MLELVEDIKIVKSIVDNIHDTFEMHDVSEVKAAIAVIGISVKSEINELNIDQLGGEESAAELIDLLKALGIYVKEFSESEYLVTVGLVSETLKNIIGFLEEQYEENTNDDLIIDDDDGTDVYPRVTDDTGESEEYDPDAFRSSRKAKV